MTCSDGDSTSTTDYQGSHGRQGERYHLRASPCAQISTSGFYLDGTDSATYWQIPSSRRIQQQARFDY